WALEVDASGNTALGGIRIFSPYTAGDQRSPTLAADGEGGFYCLWNDPRNDNPYTDDVFGSHGLSNSVITWQPTGPMIAGRAADQVVDQAIPDGAGGCLIAWGEGIRSGPKSLTMLRLDPSGAATPGWGAYGEVVINKPGDNEAPHLLPDGKQGAFLVVNRKD